VDKAIEPCDSMTDDEKIVELFFQRSECVLQELDQKYGKLFRNLSFKEVILVGF